MEMQTIMNAPERLEESPGMHTQEYIFKRHAYILAPPFYIKDNQHELLLNAHKYDFDLLFFDQLADFLMGLEISSDEDLFIVDLDCLYNVQKDKERTLFLGELLRMLPANREYVYLQTGKQSGRFMLQKMLTEYNCLAYAEKPISNENLIEKLYNLFTQHKKPEPSVALYLGDPIRLDQEWLKRRRIELVVHEEAQTLHVAVKQRQPDVVLVDEAAFRQTPAIVKVVKKNIESDPCLEVLLLQSNTDNELTRAALMNGVDGILLAPDREMGTRQLMSRIDKIRTNKALINKDRATGMLNKIGFKKRAYELIREAERDEAMLGFCIIDIDKFKTINDTWGHYFGDIVIKRLSLLLGAYVVNDNDLLSRFGGEEFVILFRTPSKNTFIQKANAMREAFNAIPFEVAPGEIKYFSFSGGISFFPDLMSENELFLQADAMLYKSKTNGRNQISC